MFQKIKQGFSRFMAGRYGVDQLSVTLLYLDLALVILGVVLGFGWLNWLSYLPMGYIIFRALSRDVYRRNQENRRYLQFLDRLKDRNNRYFRCPKCRQRVRVPRGKGKITITCPRCQERFGKKT